jgi:hypothetical protein
MDSKCIVSKLHSLYRAQPVNAMCDLRFSLRCLRRMPSSGMQKPSSYLIGNTLSPRCRAHPIDGIQILRLHGGDYEELPSSEM